MNSSQPKQYEKKERKRQQQQQRQRQRKKSDKEKKTQERRKTIYFADTVQNEYMQIEFSLHRCSVEPHLYTCIPSSEHIRMLKKCAHRVFFGTKYIAYFFFRRVIGGTQSTVYFFWLLTRRLHTRTLSNTRTHKLFAIAKILKKCHHICFASYFFIDKSFFFAIVWAKMKKGKKSKTYFLLLTLANSSCCHCVRPCVLVSGNHLKCICIGSTVCTHQHEKLAYLVKYDKKNRKRERMIV